MHLPEKLQEAIEFEIERFGWKDLTEARATLTDRYRQPSKQRQFITTEAQRCAYVAVRLPATYAVVQHVFEEVRQRTPEMQFNSLLDLGAGPGTAMWAASTIFPAIDQITLIEKDIALANLGKRIAQQSEQPAVLNANWQLVDLELVEALPKHDLIVLSYSIGELAEKAIPALIRKCWEAAEKCLVIIEPGTPLGFERIRLARSQAIALGAHMIAPCPHVQACPMMEGDWCHFPQRIERSFAHRKLKGGTLGYEDEKYSYVAFSKSIVALPKARILRHPLHHSGHVNLKLCTLGGLKNETVSKRHPEAYKRARKIEWGDIWEE